LKSNCSLNDILPGEIASVKKINICGDKRRRFMDIGLIEGTKIECIGRSPLGDPSAYIIRGAAIALRKCDCKNISVSKENGADI